MEGRSTFASEYLKRVESDAVLNKIAMTHETTSWISSWSDQLGQIMKLTDNNIIEKILTDGLKNGDSIVDTAKNISDAKIRDPGYRARRVAITETLRAHSVAQQESFMQSPAVEMKLWRHSGWREYARDNHMDIAIDGQTVRKDEPFTLFGADGNIYYPMYPRDIVLPPGESINCGCIAEPIVSDYVLGLSLEERNQLRDEAIAEMNEEYDRQNEDMNKEINGNQSVEERERLKTSYPNTVSLNALDAPGYVSKYDSITDNPAVNNAIRESANEILDHRNGTDKEDIHLLDANTGEVIHKLTTSNYDRGVVYDKATIKAIDEAHNEGRNIIAVHNHPNGLPPTLDDGSSAYKHGYEKGVVVGHNLEVYTYTEADQEYSKEICEEVHDLISARMKFEVSFEEEVWYNALRGFEMEVERL